MVVVAELEQTEVDRIFHALADATRRDILSRVIGEEQSVSALARRYAMSLPAVQKHVGVLQSAGLVGRTRIGRETRVHAQLDRIRMIRELLDRYEALWRHRVAALDDLLRDDDDRVAPPHAPTP